ncbi:MAG: hypothetical protein ACLUVC_02390 [Longibaculum sp.]
MLKNKRLDDFLVENKIVYMPLNLPKDIIGFASFKNDSYIVIVNEKHIENQMKLYGCIVNVLRNNFCYEGADKEEHKIKIKKIAKQLEELSKK